MTASEPFFGMPSPALDAPEAASLAEISSHYERGHYLTAHRLFTERLGPPESLRSTGALILGGRIANQLGARRRGVAAHFAAYKRAPRHGEAAYYYLSSCVSSRSALRFLHEVRRILREVALSPVQRSHVLGLEARALAFFRDLESADALIDEACRLSPDDPWVWVERAAVCSASDRPEQALLHVRTALTLRPDFVQGLKVLSDVLCRLGRMPEAIDELVTATTRVESGFLHWHMGTMLAQCGRHADALAAFTRAHAALLLLEPAGKSALFVERADAAYRMQRFDLALEYAREVNNDYHRELVKRLEQGGRYGRKVLEVPWVRQKHMTCAPATMASIASYFAQPVSHEELAAAICYGGTRSHGEREWALSHGFAVQEFTTTLEAAEALIDRGLPFALTTIEPTSGHLQTLHGYDSTRETLLVRDPSREFEVEYHAKEFLERYVGHGPRGMVFVPTARAASLEGLNLPDSTLYDELHGVNVALEAHDRPRAQQHAETLAARAPGHRLDLEAKLTLAHYDRDPLAIRAALAGLVTLYPESAAYALRYAAALQNLAPTAERELVLERFTVGKRAHPALMRARAELLSQDGRRQAEARHWARRAVALSPTDPSNLLELASSCWTDRRFDEALTLYRFAACLDETNEYCALTYFRATRLLGQADTGLAFLQARVTKLGTQSARPFESLFEAYRLLDRHEDGFKLLETALQTRSDGALLLFAASVYSRHGEADRARTFLEQAKGKVAQQSWLHMAARLASLQADGPHARALYEQLTALNPLDVGAQEQLASRMSESRGPEAAAAHLAAVCQRYPYHFDLASSWLSWARQVGGQAQADAIDALVRIAPHDPWVQRERAFWLIAQKRAAEALQIARQQVELVPNAPSSWGLLGAACHASLLREESMEAYRKALTLDPDYVYALDSLMDACSSTEERARELISYHETLTREETIEDGLKRFALLSRGVLDASRVAEMLEAALAKWPDLPAPYIALSREHRAHARLDAARKVLETACERFAYRSDLLLELSIVCAQRQESDASRRALERAHAIDPDNSVVAAAWVEDLLGRTDHAQAIRVCEAALLRDPADPELRLLLARARFHAGDREKAFADLELLVSMRPGYEDAWGLLEEWDSDLGRPDAALAAARALTERRPDEARSWLVLARRHAQRDDLEGVKHAVERATQLNPELADAYDILACAYARAGRWADAIEACSPDALKGRLPCTLKGRRCWVLARRGSLTDAIAGMEEVLRETPDYVTGMRWLCEFYESSEDHEGHARTARRLSPLDPDSPQTHGYVAAALLAVGDRVTAKEHLWRSVALDPTYFYGSATAFDLHLEDGELSQAEQALAHLIAHAPDTAHTVRRHIALRLKRADRTAALSCFAKLMRCDDAGSATVRKAYDVLSEAGFETQAQETFEQALGDPKACEAALHAWVDIAVEQNALHRMKRALTLDLAKPGQEVVAALLMRLIDAGISHFELWVFMLRHKAKLLSATPIWGASGYVLLSIKAHRTCARWLSDYASRQDAEAWHLYNFAQACRELDRQSKAADAHRVALALEQDHTASRHRAWAALYAALSGETTEARAHLAAEAGSHLTGHDLLARGLAQAAVACGTFARQRRYAIVAPLRGAIAQQIARARIDLNADPPLRKVLLRVLSRIASSRPWWQALWIRATWRTP